MLAVVMLGGCSGGSGSAADAADAAAAPGPDAGATADVADATPAAALDPALVRKAGDLVEATLARGGHVGVAVGLYLDGATATSGHGRRRAAEAPAPDAHTVFEIGSITKVFTATLLASLARTGEVALDGAAAEHFPAGVAAPRFGGGESFTLAQLAAHTSGLPRLPDDLIAKVTDPLNPYASYTRDDFYGFLGRHQLRRAPGSRYEYSNLGAALLGDLLASRAGTPYAALVEARILRPLGMTDTAVDPGPDLRARLAPGHDKGAEVPGWDLGPFAPAGALKSTVADLMKFLAANLAPPDAPVGRDLEATHPVRFDASAEKLKLGLGWHLARLPGEVGEAHLHDGGTGGYRSFIGFVKPRRVGVVVLANSTTDVVNLGVGLMMALIEGVPTP